ncbi:hypothetical protein ABZX98_32500 [Streptomyces sp. NPDC002992]|uniref:hypothetical protein n=1 Tax=Streptomyces sp. NPDC002992 TaxID=3154273 RepID=UPI0033AD8FF8
MTGTSGYTDNWPGRRHQDALNADLSRLLDVEAGLGEVLLESRHRQQKEALASLLDAEAGLAGILPAEPTVARARTTPDNGDGLAELTFGVVSPVERMSFRRIPRVRRAMAYADRALQLQRVMEDYIATIRRESAVLCGVLGDVLSLAFSMAPSDWDQFRSDLDEASLTVLRLEELTAGPQRQDGNQAKLAELVSSAAQLARSLLTVGHSKEALTAEATALEGEIRRARNEITHHGTIPLRQDLEEILRAARNHIAHVVSESYTLALLAIELRRGQPMRRFGVSRVRALLEDFTAADLQRADLTGIDLTGVCWSLTSTLWPEAVDVDDLRQRSEETPRGSGIYVVRSGTATVRDFADHIR